MLPRGLVLELVDEGAIPFRATMGVHGLIDTNSSEPGIDALILKSKLVDLFESGTKGISKAVFGELAIGQSR
jgi:hypothetical protein